MTEVELGLGDALGKLYVARHFKPEAKARMDTLIRNLREAYRIGIDSLEWMTPATKARAKEKLSLVSAYRRRTYRRPRPTHPTRPTRPTCPTFPLPPTPPPTD